MCFREEQYGSCATAVSGGAHERTSTRHNGYDRYCRIVLVLIALVVTPRVHLRAW